MVDRDRWILGTLTAEWTASSQSVATQRDPIADPSTGIDPFHLLDLSFHPVVSGFFTFVFSLSGSRFHLVAMK